MHRFLRFVAIVVSLVCAVACSNKELQEIQEQIRQHEAELQRLMALVEEANSDVAALRATVEQVQTGGYVTEVLPNEQNGTVVGYTLSFNTGETIYVSTGAKATPRISVKSYNEGYYWTIEDEWLLDPDGGMVAVEDGGLTPQFKAEDGNWFVSLDRGTTWMAAGKAESASSPFKSINTSNPNYVLITLSDGTVLQLTTWSAHVALKNLVNQLNNNLAATRQIVDALGEHDYLMSLSPLVEGGVQSGWIFDFAKSGTIVVYSTEPSEEDQPIIKLENGIWWISLNADEEFVPMNPEPEDPVGYYITNIDTIGEDFVRITLSDNTTLDIPKYRQTEITVYYPQEDIYIGLNESISIEFSISGTLPGEAVVSAFSDGNFVTSVSRTAFDIGSVTIQCIREFERGTVTILMNDGKGYVQTAEVTLVYKAPTQSGIIFGPFDTFEYATGVGGVIMPAEGGTRTIKIEQHAWSSHNTVEWLRTAFTQGDPYSCQIITEPNPFREDRYLTIHFHNWGTVLVKQLGNPNASPHPNWNVNSITLPCDGGSYTFFVHADEFSITKTEGYTSGVSYTKEYLGDNLWQVTFSIGPSEFDGEILETIQISTPTETGVIYFTQIAKQCID